MHENQISKLVFEMAYDIHYALGPGLLEKVYEECFFYKLTKHGFKVERQKILPIIFEEVKMDMGYRIDLIVENQVIIEVKSVEVINEIHFAQLLTYLKLSGCKLGLLINFNVAKIKYGFRRVVNNL